MFRSQKNLHPAPDYKLLYLEERRMRQQYQKRAHLAELRFRKLTQTLTKKCPRCSLADHALSREERTWQLKQFQEGLSPRLNLVLGANSPKSFRHQSKIIENFAVFGVPESMLAEPDDYSEGMEGELLFTADIPSDRVMHSAKLAFPTGVSSHYYSGPAAKDKSIQIMSSSCSYAKAFIMSFESEHQQIIKDVRNAINRENRLYAICLAVEDFTLVPALQPLLVESERIVNWGGKQEENGKAQSCRDTEISCQQQNNHIVVSTRVYCVFSKYPLFHFFQSFLKCLVGNVKTERLVMYRESGSSIAEVDSHFFLARMKESYLELSNQFEHWEMKLNKEYEIKFVTCQKLSLKLDPEPCEFHFVQEWGYPVFRQFSLQTFIDVLTLVLLEEKVVFVCEDPFILTFTIHLFTRLLPRPFKYPHPTVSLLPDREGYFNSPFPVVYGYLSSKKNLLARKIPQNYPNVYVVLQGSGVEIIAHDSRKHVLKKRPKVLVEQLGKKFKCFVDSSRRTSLLTFTDSQSNFGKDRDGICQQIISIVNSYMQDEVMRKLPTPEQVEALKAELLRKSDRVHEQKGGDLNQQTFDELFRKYVTGKGRDQFYKGLFGTQLVNVYLFK